MMGFIKRKQLAGLLLILGMILGVIRLSVASVSSSRGQADGVSKLVGNWTGESICTGNLQSCHDEKVIYRVAKTDEPDKVRITADKLVNGKPETMGVFDFKYDSEKRTLVNEFTNSRGVHGVWELKVKGDEMKGTLTLLPDKSVVRHVKVKKE
ncbi:MAG: hypothetical protein M3362_20725 [Acidobacteriota bacterium]|nr:hypothetical protein [Acidobacteriota bacterium]